MHALIAYLHFLLKRSHHAVISHQFCNIFFRM
ncbi:hypothetical protein DP23_4298 [Ralstonia pickettii]|nr:hypothetical protein DP23_4298 [Ralstonia pickettii]